MTATNETKIIIKLENVKRFLHNLFKYHIGGKTLNIYNDM